VPHVHCSPAGWTVSSCLSRYNSSKKAENVEADDDRKCGGDEHDQGRVDDAPSRWRRRRTAVPSLQHWRRAWQSDRQPARGYEGQRRGRRAVQLYRACRRAVSLEFLSTASRFGRVAPRDGERSLVLFQSRIRLGLREQRQSLRTGPSGVQGLVRRYEGQRRGRRAVQLYRACRRAVSLEFLSTASLRRAGGVGALPYRRCSTGDVRGSPIGSLRGVGISDRAAMHCQNYGP
jgi:hypothetical protein